jgi:glutathione synthase/RimK-type ligase-like ATP-grasp enzyme
MLYRELSTDVLIKLDEGTRGIDVFRVQDEEPLKSATSQFKPNIIAPVVLMAQKHVNKWFVDLRESLLKCAQRLY